MSGSESAGVNLAAQPGIPTGSQRPDVAVELIAVRDAVVKRMDAEREGCADPQCPCTLDAQSFAALPPLVDGRGRVWFVQRGRIGRTPSWQHQESSVAGAPTLAPAQPVIPVRDVCVLHVPLTPVRADRVHVGNEIFLPDTGTLAFVTAVSDDVDPADPVVIDTNRGKLRRRPKSSVLVVDPRLRGLADRVREELTCRGEHLDF